MRKLSMLLLIITTVQISLAQMGTELVSVTDMLKIKTINNITTTKDGSKAAFTVNSIVPDENNKLDFKYLKQIYSISTSGTASPIQLTSAKEGASQPAWSPDGRKLAFVRPVDGKPQIFILSMEGGEPSQLTKLKYGASNPKWSPDGTQILFSAAVPFQDLFQDSVLNYSHAIPVWPLEKPGFDKNEHLLTNAAKSNPDGNLMEIRAYLEKNVVDKKAIVLNKLNFQNEFNVTAEMDFTQFFLISTTAISEPTLITKGFYSYDNADFTPDGKEIIFSGDVDSLENPDRSLETELFIADKDGNNFKVLLGESGKRYRDASISPSGKWLAFQYSPATRLTNPTLAIMPLHGSLIDIVNIPFDRTKGNFTWSDDDKYLYFTAESNGGVLLYRVNIATKKVEALSDFDCNITSFDIAKNKIVFLKTQISSLSEIFIADADLKNEKKVTDFNNWVKAKKLSIPEKKTFVNDKGMQIEYWVMKPVNYQQGQNFPLLLEIHGGPGAMYSPNSVSTWHEFQYFCSKGYGVVYCNPRGSNGYGLDFLKANFNDWGEGPSKDVLSALDKTVAEGWADTNKLLITGGSYGGYLTAWIISHDKRFKAACSQRGVYDLLTFFGEGNVWWIVSEYFGGYPWDSKVKEFLVRESPVTYVQNITTPYIIFHGNNDRRTGFVQGEMMYRSLKVLGRPVEYVLQPNASHEITRTGDNRQRMDQMLRTFEFFERWINKD